METTKKRSPSEAREKLFAIIREIEVGMLTTVRDDGTLHTRPMVTRFDEASKALYFFTSEKSPKAGEVKEDRHVSVGYADTRRQTFAAISGSAVVVRERSLIEQLWVSTLVAWFPKGLEDKNLALLKVEVRTGEYWDAPSDTMVEIIAAVQETLDKPAPVDAGDHAKVRLR